MSQNARPLAAAVVALALLAGTGSLAVPPPGRRAELPLPLAGGRLASPPSVEPTLAAAARAMRRDDLYRARLSAEAALEQGRVWGRELLQVHYLLGEIALEEGRPRAASLHFYQVRREETPLAMWAAFKEAQADAMRGAWSVAADECGAYLERFEEGRHRDRCELLIADSLRERGMASAAISAYNAFEDERPDWPATEELALSRARALEVGGNAQAAATAYQQLADQFTWLTTQQQARRGLARLVEDGLEWEAPNSQSRRHLRAVYERDYGDRNLSHQLYEELWAETASDGPAPNAALAGTLRAQRLTFLRRNRRYNTMKREMLAAWRRSSRGEDLYQAYRAATREPDWPSAIQYLQLGQEHHRGHRRFRNTDDDLARAYMFNRQYLEAAETWSSILRRNRRDGDARWFAAYNRYRAGEYQQAIEEFDEIVDAGGRRATRARYFRARAKEALGDHRAAAAEFREITEDRPYHYYTQLIRSRERRDSGVVMAPGWARDGSWPALDPDLLIPPEEPEPGPALAAGELAAPWARAGLSASRELELPGEEPVERTLFGLPLWSAEAAARIDGWAEPATFAVAPRPESVPAPLAERVPLPDATRIPWPEFPRHWYAPDAAEDELDELLELSRWAWPELGALPDFIATGLYVEAGRLLDEVYQEVKSVRNTARKRRAADRWIRDGRDLGDEVDPDTDEPPLPGMPSPLSDAARWGIAREQARDHHAWRQLFLHAGEQRHSALMVARNLRLSWARREEPSMGEAWRISYPLANAGAVWEHARDNDLDPLLVLALTRAESLYNPHALSHAGAIGLMQIIPPTGSRVAASNDLDAFHRESLFLPRVNIQLGTWYLGQLLQRFPGQFPLAVGSYNGGPHNVGRWLQNKQGIPFDAFVEEIGFTETRRYIRKVVQFYATYCALYSPESFVQLPAETLPDDPTIIDY